MSPEVNPLEQPRSAMIVVRVNEAQKALVVQAAEREGLQLSSFIIMLLVRLHILPESSLKRIKRRPVPFFNALHGLLGVVNKIGGNCKQLAEACPASERRLHQTHTNLMEAAAALTDALRGKPLPEGLNLYRLQAELTRQGYAFNQLVKSVHAGEPQLAGLPAVLHGIGRSASAIIMGLNGQPAREDLRQTCALAAGEVAHRQQGQL